MIKPIKKLTICCCVLVFLLSFKTPALADDYNTGKIYLITSIATNLKGAPGSVVTSDLRIKNAGEKKELLHIVVQKFTASGEEGRPLIVPAQNTDECMKWISFTEDKFELVPDQWKTIRATITIPQTAATSCYYAVSFYRVNATDNPGVIDTRVTGGNSILLLLEIDSTNVRKELQLLQFTTDHKLYEYLPTTFNVKVKNLGNVHLIPSGNISVIQAAAKSSIGNLVLNSEAGNVLPDTVRVYSVKWDDGFPSYVSVLKDDKPILDNNSQPLKKLQWDWTKLTHFRFGHYTANLLMIYDNGTRDIPLEATVSFWVIPWRIMLVSLVLILLLLMGIYSVLKRARRVIRRGTE